MEKKQKTILVVGGAGFVGSNLVEELVKDKNNKVISLDNYFTGKKENHIPGAEYREGHSKDIEEHIPEKVDLVYHLGEYSRVEQSFDDVAIVWDFNRMGTVAVFEFCRKQNAKVVYAGSSTKFGDIGQDGSPYSLSKAQNTDLIRGYGKWFGLPYATTYFYNVYGKREISEGKYSTLIAKYLNLYKQGVPLPVVSPGDQLRNFTHISDIVSGLLLVGEKGLGDDFAIGAEQSYSVLEVAKMFNCEIEMLPERKGNRMSATIDTSKTRGLGWKQKMLLPEYIADSIKGLTS